MAPVDGRDDRAQMVLVGALALAVSLVVLAVVLNSAIYTENLATRSGEAGTGAVVDARDDVRDGVGGITDRVNANHAGENYAALTGTHLSASMHDWRPMVARHLAVYGRTIRVGVAGDTEGTRIADENPTSSFRPRSDGADSLGYSDSSWMVTPPAVVRSFHIAHVGTEDVPSGSPVDPKGTDVFYAEVREVQGTGDVWRVAVYENDDEVEVVVYRVGGGVVGTCSTRGPARIDLTGATVNGEQCHPLTFFEDINGLAEIHYVNGGNIAGTYELTVDRVGHLVGDPLKDRVDRANYGDQCSGPTYSGSPDTSPYAVAAIYSTEVDFQYVSQSVTYETDIRVANDEPGSGATSPRITDFVVTDSSDSTAATFDITWSSTDPNGDTVTVEAILTDLDDGTTVSKAVSGGSATLTDSDGGADTEGSGHTYEITLRVSDGTISRENTETHQADGEGATGCPP